MSYLCRFLCVCVVGLVPLPGCSDSSPDPCNGVDCDDRNECTEDLCSPTDGSCSHTALTDGSICDAGSCESGSCEPIDSIFACTEQGIRDAIAEGRGPHAFDCDGTKPLLTRAEIVIDSDVILDGEGRLTVDANLTGLPADDLHTVFRVTDGVNAELRRLTVTGGGPPPCAGMCFGSGGGIENRGTLMLTNTTVTKNGEASPADSYGILNWGTLTLTGCTISENFGGILQFQQSGDADASSTLWVTESTISDNEDYTLLIYGGTLLITNSTISFAGESSGIHTDGASSAVTVIHSTLSADGMPAAPAIWMDIDSPPANVAASIVNGECRGQIASNGYNIERPGDTCGFDEGTDEVNVMSDDLRLGPLQDNGGPTMTRALGAGSVALDRIPALDCGVTEDQRGVARPQAEACDVGAFELEVAP